jgi:tRNA (guanine37-N1)-methyltransferase
MTTELFMLNFHILTIFPNIFDSYLNESILKRAQEAGLIKINVYNLRDFTEDKHKKTDFRPYGGGPGMVMLAQPILTAIESIKSKVGKSTKSKTKIFIFSPSGKTFDNKQAISLAKKYTDIIFICGRYEGIDARVKKILKAEELSVGPFVLTGGELPAMIVIDAMSRQVKGVLGNEASPEEKRASSAEIYTRPEILEWAGKKYKVPKVLLSGDHKKIEEWREGKDKNKKSL